MSASTSRKNTRRDALIRRSLEQQEERDELIDALMRAGTSPHDAAREVAAFLGVAMI